MADVASRPATSATGSRVTSDASLQTGPAPPPPSTGPLAKKGKAKKAADDPNEAGRALQARIAQLEQDRAGKNEEDQEIEREVRKANREMQSMLNKMDNVNLRADVIHKKWTELLGELKRTEREHTRAKKRADVLQKEKETTRTELTKANSVKDRLEKLSRDLSKENKRLKEKLKDVNDNAESQNEELHQRLEQMVGDVEQVVAFQETPGRSLAEMDEDKLFKEKFKSFVEQYEMREIHVASVLRARELEIQYHIAKNEEMRKAQDAELSKSHQLTRQVSTFSQTENELRSQLNIYVEKFKQVEDTLNNSNDLFLTFRKEMEEMSKKTKRLEKENMQLTRKQEATNKNIFQMAEERSSSQKQIDQLNQENRKLRDLCRAMQANGYGRVGGGSVEGVTVEGEGMIHHGIEEDDEEEGDLVETDSNYEYDDDEDDDDDEEDYGDSTEEDTAPPPAPKKAFGPVPPPPPPATSAQDAPQQQLPNGSRKQVNGVNGIRH